MSDRKKILFILPSLEGGGAERVFCHIVNGIDRNRYVPILALGVARGRFLNLIDPEVEIHILGSYRARNLAISLLKLLWKLRPDVAVSTLGTNFALAALAPILPKSTKIILREGSSPSAFLGDVRRQSKLRAFLYSRFYRYAYGGSDSIICQSDFMLNDIKQNFSIKPELLKRIYNPVDSVRIEELSLVSSDDDIVEPGVGLLAIGRLSFEKGHDILLRAFAIVLRTNPLARLTIVGEGPELDSLVKLATALEIAGSVRFAGFEANPYRYMKRSDLVVLPSRYEGFSNVMAESWACGRAVVATDCPGANSEILQEGINGWLALNEDPRSLAEIVNVAISKLADLDEAHIKESCLSRFSLATIIPLYEREFEN